MKLPNEKGEVIEAIHAYYLSPPIKSLNEIEVAGLAFWYLSKYESFSQRDLLKFVSSQFPKCKASQPVISRVCNILEEENLIKVSDKKFRTVGRQTKIYERTIFGMKVTVEIANYWEEYRDRFLN